MKTRDMLYAVAAVAIAPVVLMAETTIDSPIESSVRIDVGSGEESILADTLATREGAVVIKQGEGRLVVPGSVAHGQPLQIKVQEGAVEYLADAAGGVPQTELSTAVKSKLALWVSVKDSAHIVPAAEGGKDIEKWYDVRETDIANPKYIYLQAEHFNNTTGPVVTNLQYVRKYGSETNEMTLAYFGGYASGITMKYLLPDDSPFRKRPYETSLVYGYSNTKNPIGYIFGNCKQTSEHTLWNENNGMPWTSTWSPSIGNTCLWVDSKVYDHGNATLPHGFHVLHSRYNSYINDDLTVAFENALFSANDQNKGVDKTLSKGGEYIGEVMFFTNELTNVERDEVNRYLEDTWFGRRTSTVKAMVSSNATVEVTADAKQTVDLQVTGEGQFVKKGAGSMVYRPQMFDASAPAAVKIEGGSVNAGRAMAVAVQPNTKIIGDIPIGENFERLTVGESARAGLIEKEGIGYAAVSSLPEGVRSVSVKAGTLAFKPAETVNVVEEVAIPNGDFSDWGDNTTKGNVYAEYGGWSRSGAVGFYNHDRWQTVGGDPFGKSVLYSAFGFKMGEPPEGRNVLMLKVADSWARVSVELNPGEYELTYLMAARPNDVDAQKARLNFYLKDADNVTYQIGTTKVGNFNIWTRHSNRFSIKKAGTYTMYVHHLPWYDGKKPDHAVVINGLHLFRLGDGIGEWKLPNGDFETLDGQRPPTSIEYVNGAIGAEGWTFDNTIDVNYVRAGVVSRRTYAESGRRWGSAFNDSRAPRGGDYQLLIRRVDGFARMSFTPPRGKWYLKADAALWGNYSDSTFVGATITAGGNVTDLGRIKLSRSRIMKAHVWPMPFESDGVTEVTMEVRHLQGAAMSGVNLDDFVLSAEYQNDNELIKNGDFEAPFIPDKSGISEREYWPHIATANGSCTGRFYGRDNWAFGNDYGSGDCFIEPYNNGTIGGFYQNVDFPHKGWYRLSYLAKTRVNESMATQNVEIAISDVATGVTNVIDVISRVPHGVFAQRTALFHVDEACTRRLSVIQWLSSGNYIAFDDFSLKFVGEELDNPLSTPDPAVAGLVVRVEKGARLHLDFSGTNVVSQFYADGVKYSGVVNSSNCPLVYGAGNLRVEPRQIGLSVTIR